MAVDVGDSTSVLGTINLTFVYDDIGKHQADKKPEPSNTVCLCNLIPIPKLNYKLLWYINDRSKQVVSHYNSMHVLVTQWIVDHNK